MKKVLALALMLVMLCPTALAAGGMSGEISLGNVRLYAGNQQAMDLSKIEFAAKGSITGSDGGMNMAFTVDGVPYDLTVVARDGRVAVGSSLLSSTYELKMPIEQMGEVKLPEDLDADEPIEMVKRMLDYMDATLASVEYAAQEPGETYTIYTGAEYTAEQVDAFEPVALDLSAMIEGYEDARAYRISGKRMITPASEATAGTALTMYKLTLERLDEGGKAVGSWPVCYLVQDINGVIVRDIDVHREQRNQLYALSERVLDDNSRSIEASISRLKGDNIDIPIAYAIYTVVHDEAGEHVAFSASMDEKDSPRLAVNAYTTLGAAGGATAGQMNYYYVTNGSAFEQLLKPEELKKGTVAGSINYEGAMGADGQSLTGEVTVMQGKYALVADVALGWGNGIDIAIGDKPVIDADSMTGEQAEALQSELIGGVMRLAGAIIGAAPELSGVVASAMEKVA